VKAVGKDFSILGTNMDFETLYNRISPRLKNLAKYHPRRGLSCDEKDLYQEMCMHLWNNFKDGTPEGINENYIINGCRFHILNYIRKQRQKADTVSMDEAINDNGDTLQDLLADTGESSQETIEKDIVSDYVKNNGFTKREKEIFFLLIKGYTAREIGDCLGISHVMVIKHKKKLVYKFKK